MKVGDQIFFAPGIRFRDLDLDGTQLPEQYGARIEGYYLTPAQRAAEAGDALASGLITLTAVDAMSRMYFGPNRADKRLVHSDFQSFAQQRLASFAEPETAKILYEKFRNGLVHEARLKDGCQFELQLSRTFDNNGPVSIIDPARLVVEVRAALEVIVCEMKSSQQFRKEFSNCVRREFSFELA